MSAGGGALGRRKKRRKLDGKTFSRKPTPFYTMLNDANSTEFARAGSIRPAGALSCSAIHSAGTGLRLDLPEPKCDKILKA